jgi:hypothetical protein
VRNRRQHSGGVLVSANDSCLPRGPGNIFGGHVMLGSVTGDFDVAIA